MDMTPPTDPARWRPRKPLFARYHGYVGFWIGEVLGIAGGLAIGWLVWGRH